MLTEQFWKKKQSRSLLYKIPNSKQQILFISDIEQTISRDRLTLQRWWLTGKLLMPVRLIDCVLPQHYESIEQ
ncbi:TPA: hypothetical protein GCU62_09760 [Legionella pneumophila]|nr:MAG: hypothetical protein BGO90_12080 [Legionella sp. 40-6]HAT8391454.1 hypothetical protein [Legionella pneumophila]HAT8403786.1 hypothetical protein [Legionella pneumophila]HAT8409920.1 hypothetical protein [Legionella pneumophila]HAT8418986.1 hypothetical protein [Legionella pneumophila]